tara:strand:- start:23314 stop:25020 length:1707 start_codon:yes stop_codon:yes gene_type:complete
MKSNTLFKKIEDYEYNHVYDLFRNYFQFDESKYEYLIKDLIKVLIEFEKKGETIIDIDNVKITFELFNDDWPNKHINCLLESGLNDLPKPPIIIKDRKISWSKWSTKLEIVRKKLLNKINIQDKNKFKFSFNSNKDNIYLIKSIFNYSNLVLLQGGPGTGKTTLIINLILITLAAESSLNIGLAAPTGKATARIKEALNFKLDLSDINLKTLECQTLHSWIYNYKNKSGKLKLSLKDLDYFFIDECSMVGIDIIENVLNLINRDCKIILVGDANQLPPVNNCSVWNNIFENMNNDLFNYCTVNLNTIYRNNGDIQELSKLIFNNNKILFKQKVNEILNSKKPSNVSIQISKKKDLPNILKEEVIKFIKILKTKTLKLSNKKYIFEPNIDNLLNYERDIVLDIFNTLNSQLILCSRNIGTWSVKEVNSIIIKENETYDFFELDEGIPVICTENNTELGISNGDIGVIIGRNETRRFLFKKFNTNNEPVVELIEPNRLENILPAIAITIHKSQGSEAEKVFILWNKDYKKNNAKDFNFKNIEFYRDNYEKRLLYTGITRAKKRLDLFYLE